MHTATTPRTALGIAPRIAITPGEPAGIGPDLLVQLAQQSQRAQLIAFASGALLQSRAAQLGLPLQLVPFDANAAATANGAGVLHLANSELATLPEPGQGDAANAGYVLACLDNAIAHARTRQVDALVTGPVHKHLINSGLRAPGDQQSNKQNGSGSNNPAKFFSGHTEYLAEKTGTAKVVMLLSVEQPRHLPQPLRVALVTTHLPLREVPAAITQASVTETLIILQRGLVEQFGIERPRILVCGLNPHAGEQGDLGREEIDHIQPAIEQLRAGGANLSDALPADTLFTAAHLRGADAVLAMYHDQGLPVLKSHGFGDAVNITLGLPFVRTSVDHGTAFDLAGTGRANIGSLQAALDCAIALGARAHA